MFSYEKKFNWDGPHEYAYYRHDVNKEEKIFSKRCIGGESVMVWGCFGVHDGPLNLNVRKVHSVVYTDMLKTQLLPLGEDLGGPA